jgi:hypothetical protein
MYQVYKTATDALRKYEKLEPPLNKEAKKALRKISRMLLLK